MNKELRMTDLKLDAAIGNILNTDPVLYTSFRIGTLKQARDELLESAYMHSELARIDDEIKFLEHLITLLKKDNWMTNLEYDAVLATIEEMQYVLERKVEWSLTDDALAYEKVKEKVGAAQVALNDLYVYVMSVQWENANDWYSLHP